MDFLKISDRAEPVGEGEIDDRRWTAALFKKRLDHRRYRERDPAPKGIGSVDKRPSPD